METNKELSLYRKIIRSFDNQPGGFSARKLSAFVGVMTAVVATFKFVDSSTIVMTIGIWLTFSLLCLGIITAEQIIRFREGKNNKEDNSDPNV